MQNAGKSILAENVIRTRPSYWCWFFPRDRGKDPWPTQCVLVAKIMVLKMQSLRTSLNVFLDGLIPATLKADPENTRRSRLIIRFSLLGSFFGLTYGSFYWMLSHFWGMLIVFISSSILITMPLVLYRTGSLTLTGNLHAAVLALGFIALCCVEGGMRGHAIAWLVSVPLCALLLVGKCSAKRWASVCLIAGTAIVGLNAAGFPLPVTYPAERHDLISATGYLGLILFMVLLGLMFEKGREQAFEKVQRALVDLENANKDLTRLNQEKTEFIGIAAHDLRNPLTAVSGWCEILNAMENPTREQIRECSAIIQTESARMRDLISRFLDGNALEEGRYPWKIQRCDLAALAGEVVESYRSGAEKKSIQLIYERPANVMSVTADAQATGQVLDNLISNAVKYSPLRGQVFIRIHSTENKIYLEVEDQGPGITPEDSKQLFGRFSRLSAQPTGGETSIGLGLSIVKRLTEAMSGTVAYHSNPHAGATFVLSLPRWLET